MAIVADVNAGPVTPGDRLPLRLRSYGAAQAISSAAIHAPGWFDAAKEVEALREDFPDPDERSEIIDHAVTDIEDEIQALERQIEELNTCIGDLQDAQMEDRKDDQDDE